MARGRRIQHVEGQDPYHELTEPGDYMLVTTGRHTYEGRPAVWFFVPAPLQPPIDDPQADQIKRIVMCASPPHVFRECPDGSLEIRESILVSQRWAGTERSWHGYLDEGNNWRTV